VSLVIADEIISILNSANDMTIANVREDGYPHTRGGERRHSHARNPDKARFVYADRTPGIARAGPHFGGLTQAHCLWSRPIIASVRLRKEAALST
jgi:hypothetical protein